MIDRFEACLAMPDDALRALLAGGEPRARVWAAWALGLRRGEVGRELAGRVGGEPHAGVRRHLVIVLAGAGELDVVVALGRLDPDPAVRADAMRLVARFAAAGTIPWAVVRDGLGDDADEVRAAIAGELGDGAPDELVARVVAEAASPSPALRALAFHHAVRTGRAARARVAVEHARAHERSRMLAAWRAAAGVRAVSEALATAAPTLRLEALREVDAPTWAEIAPLVRLDEPAIVAVVVDRFRGREGEVPVEAQARLAARGAYVDWTYAAAVADRVERDEPVDRELVAALARRIADELATARAELAAFDPDEEDSWRPSRDELAGWIEGLEALLDRLLRA